MQSENSSFGEKLLEANCKLSVSLQAPIDAKAEIWTLGLAVKPSTGTTLFVPFTETARIEAQNYRISAVTASDTIALFSMGPAYDNFSKRLVESWGDALAKALLMHEPNIVYEAPAYYGQTTGASQSSGSCRARIYETSLVILPSDALPRKIPLSSIQSSALDGFRLRVSTSTATYEFSRMGNATQLFSERLTGAQRALEASSIQTIRTMIPSATYEELHKLSMRMVEGRAAMRKDVETISPDLWLRLEKSVAESPLAETYSYLSSLGEKGRTAIGLRKSKENVYVWFLIPVKGSPEDGGNALVMEVTSETGHATYLFWVVKRKEFPSCTSEQFSREGELLISELNEAMIATGFRREPIYLSEERLNQPAYSKYLFAAKNLEPLRLLRERFFARIIHHTFEQWKQDLLDSMLFNTSAAQEDARWAKSDLLEEQEPTA